MHRPTLALLIALVGTPALASDSSQKDSSLKVLEAQRTRLTREIESLEKRIEADKYSREWMKAEDTQILKLKRQSARAVNTAEALVKSDTAKDPIRDLRDTYRLGARVELGGRTGKASPPEFGRMGKVIPDLGMRYGKVRPLVPDTMDLIEELLRGRGRDGKGDETRRLIEGIRDSNIDPDLLRQLMLGDKKHEEATAEAKRANARAVAAFYERLDVTPVAESKLPASIDLSSRFPAPQLQGRSLACVAFAITSDMASFKGIPLLSAGMAYTFINAPIDKLPYRNLSDALMASLGVRTREDLHEDMDIGVESIDKSLSLLKDHPVAPEENHPFEPRNFVPTDLHAIADRVYSIRSWAKLTRGVTADVLKQLLAAGKPLMLAIDTDGRYQFEDWLVPDPVAAIKHIVNLVGYGTATDPVDGVRKAYFLIRDSLGRQRIHYKVSETALMPRVEGIYKVLRVRVWEKAPEYKRFE